MPAPPPESEPAMVMATGRRALVGMSAECTIAGQPNSSAVPAEERVAERRDQAHQLFEPDLVSTSVGKRDETDRTPGCACLRALSDGRLEASRRDTRMATESSRSRS